MHTRVEQRRPAGNTNRLRADTLSWIGASGAGDGCLAGAKGCQVPAGSASFGQALGLGTWYIIAAIPGFQKDRQGLRKQRLWPFEAGLDGAGKDCSWN